jgi:hypothetical protein
MGLTLRLSSPTITATTYHHSPYTFYDYGAR